MYNKSGATNGSKARRFLRRQVTNTAAEHDARTRTRLTHTQTVKLVSMRTAAAKTPLLVALGWPARIATRADR